MSMRLATITQTIEQAADSPKAKPVANGWEEIIGTRLNQFSNIPSDFRMDRIRQVPPKRITPTKRKGVPGNIKPKPIPPISAARADKISPKAIDGPIASTRSILIGCPQGLGPPQSEKFVELSPSSKIRERGDLEEFSRAAS